MKNHWGASEKEILLSEGSKDNPNMEGSREIYKLMYFVKDNSKENGVVYFIKPRFSLAQAYKIVLPRKVQFLVSGNIKELFLPGQKWKKIPRYFVFKREDTPDFCQEEGIRWDESGWGIHKCENL